MALDLVVSLVTESAVAPVGVVPGQRRFDLVDAAGVVVQSAFLGLTEVTHSFLAVAPGTYVAHVQQLDVTGAAMGDIVVSTGSVTVDVPPVEVGVTYEKVITVSLATAPAVVA